MTIKKFITASTFGCICKRRKDSAMIRQIFHKKPMNPYAIPKSILWGNALEEIARERYEFETGEKVVIQKFTTDKKFLGCTPDGVISSGGMIEIKCPYILRVCRDIKEAPKNLFCKVDKETGRITLPKNHNYYYQIQGMMGSYSAERLV